MTFNHNINVFFITVRRKEHSMRMMEERDLIKTVEPERKEVTGCYTKRRNEELNVWYSAPDIGAIKSRNKRWAGNVTGMAEMGDVHRFRNKNLK
jgi:hypothetical protein